MNNTKNKCLTPFSQQLRREMTKEEKHLWYDFLKKLPYTINRQKVINHYILDFYCAKAKLCIELDGSQHYDKESREYDSTRTKDLEAIGIKVIRYSNYDLLKNFDGICQDILRQIESRINR